MIRQARPEDTDAILDVWLLASLQAHDFVPAAYWWQQQEQMRARYLPLAEVWVYEREGNIQGFVALADNYLAALFVRPDCQQRGIGRALMATAKRRRRQLLLKVYCENDIAVNFYRQHGFAVTDESTDPGTGQPQLCMGFNSRLS